eukprot:PhF_6_TR5694/c0_g1_i2/m.8393
MGAFASKKSAHWKPDSSAAKCDECGTLFSFTRRRHHCRDCGGIFCAPCSSYARPIPYRNITEPVRVCKTCYSHFTELTNDSLASTWKNTARNLSQFLPNIGGSSANTVGAESPRGTGPQMTRAKRVIDDVSGQFLPARGRGNTLTAASSIPKFGPKKSSARVFKDVPLAIGAVKNSVQLVWAVPNSAQLKTQGEV